MRCLDVMTKDPACCLSTDTVQKAAELMRMRDVGPVPVVEDPKTRRLLGIITDRDVAVNVVGQGRDPKKTKVGEVMTRELATSRPDEELDLALDRMMEWKVRRLPIVDDENRLVGIIAQADVATQIEEPQKTATLVREISEP